MQIGDHTTLIGEVIDGKASEKEPLAYHAGKYFKLETIIQKPGQAKLDEINKTIQKFKKSGQ